MRPRPTRPVARQRSSSASGVRMRLTRRKRNAVKVAGVICARAGLVKGKAAPQMTATPTIIHTQRLMPLSWLWAAVHRRPGGLAVPAARIERLHAHQTEEDDVGRTGILRVILQARALEVLHRVGLAVGRIDLGQLPRDR